MRVWVNETKKLNASRVCNNRGNRRILYIILYIKKERNFYICFCAKYEGEDLWTVMRVTRPRKVYEKVVNSFVITRRKNMKKKNHKQIHK